MAEATRLKLCRRGHFKYHDFHAEFHKLVLIGARVTLWDKYVMGRLKEHLLSVTFLLKESRFIRKV